MDDVEERAGTVDERREDLADALRTALVAEGVPDALMFQRVSRLRELLREFDRELEVMERYFRGGVQTPPS